MADREALETNVPSGNSIIIERQHHREGREAVVVIERPRRQRVAVAQRRSLSDFTGILDRYHW